MTKITKGTVALLLAALAAGPVAAQSSMSAPCENEFGAFQQTRDFCLSVAQAVESAQPQLGILTAGGNPTLGTASAGGMRLGFIPRVSATARLNVVFVRLPEILAEQAGGQAQHLNETIGLPMPAISGAVSVGVFPGFSPLPLIGGIGAVDLLASATVMPFQAFNVDGFGEEAPDLAWGIGARVGLLRESFVMPGISLSLMHHRLGHVRFGNVCENPTVQQGPTSPSGETYTVERGVCAGGGDAGEFEFDLQSWSGRLAISKRLLGFGLTAGVGHDRSSSSVAYGVELPEFAPHDYVRIRNLELDSGRTNFFVNGSFTLLVATLAVEAGWLQGATPLPQYDELDGSFDPRSGTFFASVGARLSF